jgi:hypothetical protein
VFLGLAAFLTDAALAAAFENLHAATVSGSALAFDLDSERLAGNPGALGFMGPAFHMRTPESFRPLLGPWRLTDAGIAPVATWPESPESTVPDTNAEMPAFYGGIALH